MTEAGSAGHRDSMRTGSVSASEVPGSAPAAPAPAPASEFAQLFREHADFVWRVLKRMGIPDAEAEDALQEVFLVVSRRIDGYEERGALRAWLFSIARQVAQHTRRSYARRERRHQALPPSAQPEDPHQAVQRGQAVEAIRSFLASLDETQASVFYLAELEGLTAPEISAALQVNLNTVYGRLRLARKRFEAWLREQPDAPW